MAAQLRSAGTSRIVRLTGVTRPDVTESTIESNLSKGIFQYMHPDIWNQVVRLEHIARTRRKGTTTRPRRHAKRHTRA